MDVRETILQITVATLAVIGLCDVMQSLFEALFAPRELAVAVVVAHVIPPEELDILLGEARRVSCGRGKGVVLVITPDLWRIGLTGERAYADIIEKYGAVVCVTEAAR